jgi:hypothetical protein
MKVDVLIQRNILMTLLSGQTQSDKLGTPPSQSSSDEGHRCASRCGHHKAFAVATNKMKKI